MMSNFKVNVGTNSYPCDLHLLAGENLFTDQEKIENTFGTLNSIEQDLLNLAAAIYATDLSFLRKEREEFIRTIHLNIDIINLHAFERIKDKLKRALLILSSDNWIIKFNQSKGVPTTNLEWENKEGCVLLFSGGIDSMCAASDFIANPDLYLVSHITHGNRETQKHQIDVREALEKYYKKSINHIQIKVFGRKKGKMQFPTEREVTQRTRSFLFLTLGTIVTKKCGFNKVLYMAENGQFALHLPLTTARIGPFSTHTADPEFIKIFEEIVRILLNNPKFEIINPYMYKTKADMVATLPKKLKIAISKSNSCWNSRIFIHCGECLPCISRRIANEFNGIKLDEYRIDLFNIDFDTLDDFHTGKRNIIDYIEFILKFDQLSEMQKKEFLLTEAQELLNTNINQDEALKMYKRLAYQSITVLKKYPHVKKLM